MDTNLNSLDTGTSEISSILDRFDAKHGSGGKKSGSYRLEVSVDAAVYLGFDIDFGATVNFNSILKPTKFTGHESKVLDEKIEKGVNRPSKY